MEGRKEAAGRAAAARGAEAIEGRFVVVARRFLAEHVEPNCSPKYAGEVRRILEHRRAPPLGRSADPRDRQAWTWNELLDAKARGRDVRARAPRRQRHPGQPGPWTRLRTLFAWAEGQGLVDAGPLGRSFAARQGQTRDRVLCGGRRTASMTDEILWFWRGARRAGWPYGAIFRLLLLTAQRGRGRPACAGRRSIS